MTRSEPPGAPWRIDLAVGEAAVSNTCLYPAPGALQGVTLPKLLVVQGPDGARRLVGVRRVGGAEDRTAVWVSPALLEHLAPGRPEHDIVPATVRSASWADIVVLTSHEANAKVISALLSFLAAGAAAGVAFATSKVSVGVALLVLILVCVAGLYTARNSIRDALTPKC